MAVVQPLTTPIGLRRRFRGTVQPADIAAVSCVVLALWIVYFRALPDLGLYTDDYYNVGFPSSLNFSQVWNQCLDWMIGWPNGRPLSACFGWLASFALVRIAGLHAIYLVPFSLISANSLLIYYIVSRKTLPLAGFIAGVSYAISPIDTLRLNYTVAFQYQACIAVTLVALILYDRGKHAFAYVTLIASLLFHECAILGFMAAPILSAKGRELPMRFFKNAVIVGCIIVVVLYVRAEVMGETRSQAAASSATSTLLRSVTSATRGPLTHLHLLRERAMQSVTQPLVAQVKGTLGWLLLVLGAGMAVVAARGEGLRRGGWGVWVAALKTDRLPSGDLMVAYARVFAAGVFIFVVNYLVFFLDPYYPANHTAGMIGLVHTASGVGASLWIAVVMMALIAALSLIELRVVGLAVVLIYLASLGAWGTLVRGQYVESWKNQKLFWKRIVTTVPDATEGTIIIVQSERLFDLPFTWIIPSNSWSDAVVPRMLYRCSWNSPPMVYVFSPSWVERLQSRNGEIGWIRPPSLGIPGWEPLSGGNLVVILAKDGRFTRLQGSLGVPQGLLPLKPIPPPGTTAKIASGLISNSILR